MPTQAPTTDLHRFVAVLRRRKWVVVLTAVAALLAVAVVDFTRSPTYEATAEVLVAQDSTLANQGLSSQPGNLADRRLANEMAFLRSDVVRKEIVTRLGAPATISVTADARSDVLKVTVQAGSPERAALAANTAANAFIDLRRQTAIDDAVEAASLVQQQLDGIEEQRLALTTSLEGLPGNELVARQAAIQPEINRLDAQASTLTATLNGLQIGQGLAESSGASVIQEAVPPSAPVSPSPGRDLMLAGVAGLLLGIALAFIVDLLDESIKSEDDVKAVDSSLAFLGAIPQARLDDDAPDHEILVTSGHGQLAAEAYRTLRSSVMFASLRHPLNRLLITSASPGEGKTRTAVNLALAFAMNGSRVVLADVDWRRSRVHSVFGLPKTPGFSSIVVGESQLGDAARRVPQCERLVVLPSGPPPPQPADLLGSSAAQATLGVLSGHADLVVLDSPPVLAVSDCLVLAREVDAVVIVVRAGATSRRSLGRALERLRQTDTPILGYVLNGVRGGDGYHDYYTPDEEASGRRWWRRRHDAPPPLAATPDAGDLESKAG